MLFLLLGWATGGAGAASPRLLLVYDVTVTGTQRSDWLVPALSNLLGHFDGSVTALPSARYRAGQVAQYEAVCYLGGVPARLPQALLADLYDSDRPVCWIGKNLEQLAARFSLGRYGFHLTPAAGNFEQVRYRGQLLPRAPAPLAGIALDDPNLCHLLATAEAKGRRTPYAVRAGRLWYFPEAPFAPRDDLGASLALADQLHDVLAQHHPPRRSAAVIITGLTPESNPRAVRRLVRVLSEARVPYALAVTPQYLDPEGAREVRLAERPALVEVLQEAQQAGAALIVSGLTSQSAGRTGTEAEFWDEVRHGPLLERSSEDTHRRLTESVAQLVGCGLYPTLWSTPRGLASPADYVEIAACFSTAWERRLPGLAAPAPQLLPYSVRRDSYGQQLFPDNLPPLTGNTEVVLSSARRLEAVTDPFAGLALSPETDPRAVKAVLRELRRHGWGFQDLRQLDTWVKSEPITLRTAAQTAPLGTLLPPRWNATVVAPGQAVRALTGPGEQMRRETHLAPGDIVVASPPGFDLVTVFTGQKPLPRATHALVGAVTRLVTLFGVIACSLFFVIYLGHTALHRRRA